jgi:hypothetical protein
MGFVRRPLQRLIQSIIARVLLFLEGFLWIDSQYVPSKRRNPFVFNTLLNLSILICGLISDVTFIFLAPLEV